MYFLIWEALCSAQISRKWGIDNLSTKRKTNKRKDLPETGDSVNEEPGFIMLKITKDLFERTTGIKRQNKRIKLNVYRA